MICLLFAYAQFKCLLSPRQNTRERTTSEDLKFKLLNTFLLYFNAKDLRILSTYSTV